MLRAAQATAADGRGRWCAAAFGPAAVGSGGSVEAPPADLYHGVRSHRARKFPTDVVAVALRKLDMINAAHLVAELRSPPGNRLETPRGKRSITPETAWFLSQAFGTTPEFWLNLQAAYGLALHRPPRRIQRLQRAS